MNRAIQLDRERVRQVLDSVIRVGKVVVKMDDGRLRVRFKNLKSASGEPFISTPYQVLDGKDYDLETQVLCLCLPIGSEVGFVLGAV
jgi:hypothetical protein